MEKKKNLMKPVGENVDPHTFLPVSRSLHYTHLQRDSFRELSLIIWKTENVSREKGRTLRLPQLRPRR